MRRPRSAPELASDDDTDLCDVCGERTIAQVETVPKRALCADRVHIVHKQRVHVSSLHVHVTVAHLFALCLHILGFSSSPMHLVARAF